MNRNLFITVVCFIISTIFLAFSGVPVFAAQSEVSVIVDGNEVEFDQPPVIMEGRTLVPVRAIAQAMGFSVNWDEPTKQIKLVNSSGKIVVMAIGNPNISIIDSENEKTISVDVAPQIIGGRTLIPLRALGDSVDAEVEWIGQTQTVIITSENPLVEGYYSIKLLNGGYFSGIDGLGITSVKKNDWYLRDAGNGAFYIHAESPSTNKLIDLNNDWDIEGNTVGLFADTGYTMAQTWKFIPNGDGTFLIQTVHESGRVISANFTIETYAGVDSQKWELTAIDSEDRSQLHYKKIMMRVNGYKADDILISKAEGSTDAAIKALLAANSAKQNMVEGKYVVVHLPNTIWSQIEFPKKFIDNMDFIFEAQMELLGGDVKIYEYKLLYLTNENSDATGYMYMAYDHCAFTTASAQDLPAELLKEPYYYPGWGVGHEMGHAMVNIGMGELFDAHAAESWNNILNVYAYYKFGAYDAGVANIKVYPQDYPNSGGVDYDLLPDSRRTAEILADNTWVFAKLPMLIIDNYGWSGMRKFFTTAADDASNGVKKSENIQDRIDYMAINLSKAYGMDFSGLFDYWQLSPTASARAEVAGLPKDVVIAKRYGLNGF